MALKLTKNSTIILTSIILVLSIALGFLIWRVNQEETTAPTDTEAEGEGQSCSVGANCTEITCYWPYVSYCQNRACECRLRENQTINPCTDSSPNCTPESPGGNYKLCHYWDDNSQKMITEPGCEDGASNTVEKVCKTTCSSCNNPYFYQTRYKLIEEEPSCGDGKIDTGEECDPEASPQGCDIGMVCNSSCLCETPPRCGDGKINGTGEECEPPGSVCTKESKSGVCSSLCKCTLDPYCGDGKLGTNEKCEVGDPTGTQCSWSACNQTACTCLPAGLNISKTVVESCIAEGTENPSSQLIYTITVRNTGSGKGQISKIEDVLDSKVLAKGITPTDIVGGGVYSSGKIVWNFSPALDILAGATQTYSYKVVIDKGSFGTYNNTVTLTPVSGNPIQANASINADCLAITPRTGIFDSTLGRISAGFVLLLLGGFVYSLPSGFFSLNGREKKFRYRVKFESKMFKK